MVVVDVAVDESGVGTGTGAGDGVDVGTNSGVEEGSALELASVVDAISITVSLARIIVVLAPTLKSTVADETLVEISAGASGKTNDHESTRSAPLNDLPTNSVISVALTKFPQNICAVLVPNVAELSVVKSGLAASMGRSGLPSTF